MFPETQHTLSAPNSKSFDCACNTGAKKRKLSDALKGMPPQGRNVASYAPSPQDVIIRRNSQQTMLAKQRQPVEESLKRRRMGSLENTAIGDDDTTSIADSLDPNGPETPDAFLKKILSLHCHLEIDDTKMAYGNIKAEFLDIISPEGMTSYPDVVPATRQNNVAELRRLQESGHSLNCCNPFGESLIHIACRRGFVETVKFFLEQPNLTIRLADDCGRTPLHDLCWNPSPQFELCKLLLEREPSLFFLRDKRNFTPFEYSREEHWTLWKRFLLENKSLFEKMEKDACYHWMFSRKDRGDTACTP